MDPLIVDCYPGDGQPNWDVLAAAGVPWVGAYIKATQGTHWKDDKWFGQNWTKLLAVGVDRYGKDWSRGAYHYLDARINGTAQAEHYLATVGRAGGFGPHDFMPMVDVERAGNEGVSASAMVKCTSDFVYRVHEVTGRQVMLYGGEYLYALGITDHCGATLLAVARYTESLPLSTSTRIGWPLGKLGLWQYCGDGVSYLKNYPSQAPGCGPIDISAVVLGWNRLAELMH